jgi:hypothetical protein
MAEGIISKYARRDGPKEAPRPETPTGEKKPYTAHDGKDRQIYLKLHPYKHRTSAVDYKHLFLFEYDDEIFETLVLEFGFMEALIRGKNLAPIVSSLNNHTCEFIREFHPDVHEDPGEGKPIVTEMHLRSTAAPAPAPAPADADADADAEK